MTALRGPEAAAYWHSFLCHLLSGHHTRFAEGGNAEELAVVEGYKAIQSILHLREARLELRILVIRIHPVWEFRRHSCFDTEQRRWGLVLVGRQAVQELPLLEADLADPSRYSLAADSTEPFEHSIRS